MIPNLAIFFGEHLKAKLDADTEFRNSFAISAALRFVNLAYLSGIEQGLSPHRHGMNDEVFRDLQSNSVRQGAYQRAFNRAHLIECHLHLYTFDYIRAEVTVIGFGGDVLFSWTAVFQPDGSGDITNSRESHDRKPPRSEIRIA